MFSNELKIKIDIYSEEMNNRIEKMILTKRETKKLILITLLTLKLSFLPL